MEHQPFVTPTQKLGLHVPAWSGACSCGWVSSSFATVESQALKMAQAHADDKNAVVRENRTTGAEEHNA